MITKKKIVSISLLIFLACIVIFAVFQSILARESLNENMIGVQVYFLNPVSNGLEAELHYVEKGEDTDIARAVLEILYAGPRNNHLAKTVPDYVQVKGRIVDNDALLEVEFSDDYSNMSPIEELFFRSSLVWTMTDLNFINDVRFYVGQQELLRVNGQPMGLLNRNNVLINPLISPNKINNQVSILYFRNADDPGFVGERRVIQVNPNIELEEYVMKQLIAGPVTRNLQPTISADTIVRNVRIDEDICYVNLSSDFITKQPGTEDNFFLNIASIVNSLTALGNVSKVQFLIDTERIELLKGGFDLSKPIEPHQDVIIR